MKALKQIILAVALFVMAAPGIFAANETNKLTYDYKDFSALEVSWQFSVEVIQSNTWSVEVEVSTEVTPYLLVEKSGSKLRIAVKGLPRSITNQRNWNPVARAKVTMPTLTDVSLSGATKLTAEGTFKTNGTFSFESSGASKIVNLNVEAKKFDFDCSGASKFTIACKADDVDMDLSGASKGTLELNAGSLDLDASGASSLKISGNATNADIDCSGACNIDLLKTDVKVATVDLSGASKCQISVKEKLSVELSGASSLRYEDNHGLRINPVSISRGSSLSKL